MTDQGMRLLYVTSGGSAIDTAATGQLSKAVGRGRLTQVESAGAALAELQSAPAEYRALLISPGFSEPETLALIRGLRNEGAPVAIVPVVTEAHRGLCSSAVRAGAEAVLLMVNGVLIDAQETLSRILPRATAAPVAAQSRPPATIAATKRALAELRKLHSLLYGKGRAADDETPSEFSPGEGGRLGLGLNPPSQSPEETASPAGAARMPEKPRSTYAPATAPTLPPRRPILSSVPPPTRAAEKTFDGRTRAALEAALQASRVELRRAADAHAAEREVWEATRKELEARSDEIHSDSRGRVDLENELNEAKVKFAAATDSFAADRAAWDNTRRELEMRVKTLQAVIGSTRKIEAELRTTQADLQQVMTSEGSKEAAWEETRARLEAEIDRRGNELEAAHAARSHVETSLEAAHAELQQLSRTHADAVETWERARQELQQEISDLQAAAGESARHDSVSVEQVRGEIEQARRAADKAIAAAEARADARASEARAEAETVRAELETRNKSLDELRSEHARLAAAYRGLEGKLSEARERVRQLDEGSQANRAAASAAVASGPLAAAEQRRDVSRIEQVGKLGSAMAPEIETLVSAIDQAAARLVKQLDASSPQRAELEVMLKNSSRATSLVRQLVTFSRKQAKPIVRVDLNEVARRAEPSLARLLGGEIDLKLALGAAASLAAGEDDVEQILTALMFSAREALTLGGTVVLATAIADGSRAQLTATALGYGVQPAKSSTALDVVLKRCGGEVTLGGEPGRDAVVQVVLPLA
jgi:hypothetical protein